MRSQCEHRIHGQETHANDHHCCSCTWRCDGHPTQGTLRPEALVGLPPMLELLEQPSAGLSFCWHSLIVSIETPTKGGGGAAE